MFRFLFISVNLFFLTIILYAQSCECDVSNRKERSYDALLQLDATEKAEPERTHLPRGVPEISVSATYEHLLHQAHYLIDYDDDLRVPILAAYRLIKEVVEVHREWTECFRKDIRLADSVASFCVDYDEPEYDRGHLVPNADMTRSEAAMINTYILSNITPQHDVFNRIIWSQLEGYVCNWAVSKGDVYVITRCVFDKNRGGQKDKDSDANLVPTTNKVAIPTHFYRIIFYERPNGSIESMTFLLPHEKKSIAGKPKVDKYLKNYFTAIDSIEAVTGINFLPELG